MSDSDRWWVIALLVVFMVGGLLWLLWSRMRSHPAAATTAEASGWHAMTETGVVPESSVTPTISTADVTLSRGPYLAEAIGLTTNVDSAEVVVSPAGDVGEVERAEMDATLAAGGALPADAGVAATGGSALESLAGDVGAATVGSELSDRAWVSASRDAVPASASTVVVVEVHYGADGHEHGDHEWVLLTNSSPDAVDLAGWRLTDEGAKHEYAFPSHALAPGGSIRIHMARGEDASADLYVGRNARWWNNEGDCAYLYDAAGALVDVHCYGNAVSV